MNLTAVKELLPGVPSPGDTYFRMSNEVFKETINDIGPSFLFGGRYNPKLEFGVLYLSVSPECAYMERIRQVKGRKDNLSPQIIAAFQVKIEKCLDLFHPDVERAIEVRRDELIRTEDFFVPQSIARMARNAGFEAIIAPSAAGTECKNLVVFKDKLSPPSYCTVKAGSVRPYLGS